MDKNQSDMGSGSLYGIKEEQQRQPADFMQILKNLVAQNEEASSRAKRLIELYNNNLQVQEFVELMKHFQRLT